MVILYYNVCVSCSFESAVNSARVWQAG